MENLKIFHFSWGIESSLRIYIYERAFLFERGDIFQMRSNEERIILLHAKADRLQDLKMMRIYGTVSMLLLGILMGIMAKIHVPFEVVQSSGFTGSSLFGDEAGAYVLVAVISFVAAVGITVYFMRKERS